MMGIIAECITLDFGFIWVDTTTGAAPSIYLYIVIIVISHSDVKINFLISPYPHASCYHQPVKAARYGFCGKKASTSSYIYAGK